jgi:hypothetical protein
LIRSARSAAAHLVLAAVVVAATASATDSPYVTPLRAPLELESAPPPDGTPTALAYRGEVLRVDAVTAQQDFEHLSLDGRSGWAPTRDVRPAAPPSPPAYHCRSEALGTWDRGRLRCGRRLPPQGTGFQTWDFPLGRSPNRSWRRWGTEELIARILWIGRRWQSSHPLGPRLLVGDLSRRRGGPFGPRYGGVGHSSHQNGLDVDIFYPRADGTERVARRPAEVDHGGAMELLALARRSGARLVLVGCHVGLPAHGRVEHLCNGQHENHLHVRFASAARPTSSPARAAPR